MVKRSVVILAAVWVLSGHVARGAEYDPLAVSKTFEPQTLELSVRDESRKRDIPLKCFLPAKPQTKTDVGPAAPVLLFSHGLGGSREMGGYLGKHWSARGYVAIFLQHPGSDDSVWKDVGIGKRMAAMQEAASPENMNHRLLDVPAVLGQLEKWNKQADHMLAGRLDMTRVGMSGHSFGALTTQGVSGQSVPVLGHKYNDPRIKAAVVMSPGSPRAGDTKTAFGSVKTPWLLMTGTNDTARIGGQTVESRLAVYPALPAGGTYELVLNERRHSAFTDRAVPGETRNPNHHRSILATSTAFWDAYLRDDAAAKAWLDGAGPRSVLESADKWQKK